jgi:hypothetical protein
VFPKLGPLRKLRVFTELVRVTVSGCRTNILEKNTWGDGLPNISKAISWW